MTLSRCKCQKALFAAIAQNCGREGRHITTACMCLVHQGCRTRHITVGGADDDLRNALAIVLNSFQRSHNQGERAPVLPGMEVGVTQCHRPRPGGRERGRRRRSQRDRAERTKRRRDRGQRKKARRAEAGPHSRRVTRARSGGFRAVMSVRNVCVVVQCLVSTSPE